MKIPFFSEIKTTFFGKKDNEIKFRSLSPKRTIKDSSAFEALDHAVEDDSILNIAVTAPYGAGKSSIVKSYFCDYRKWDENRILYVSLACFNDSYVEEKKCKNIISDIDEDLLENSILQQLFFSETVQKLPWSNYFRIKNYKIKDISIIVLTVFSCLCVLLKMGYFEKVDLFFLSSFKCLNLVPSGVIAVLFFISLYLVIEKIVWFVRKVHSIKWNSVAGEIEVEKKYSSPLNDKIDEILYFFEATKYKYVVFEDLDRFESKKIFIKLRELNKLINGYKGISKYRKIKFVYALNDDVFSSRDRVKFFDFIIPIIPKISRTNVGDFFLSYGNNSEDPVGKECNLLKRLNKNVVNDLGFFVDDLRLLNNIENEFIIYCKSYYSPDRLKELLENKEIEEIGKKEAEEREITELFCLILYKNLYPEDFKKCHFGKGTLFNLFQLEKNIIDYCKSKISGTPLNEGECTLQRFAQVCPQYVKEYLNCKQKDVVDFLVAFVGRGFITKRYASFISFVYPGELSNDDFALLKKMKNTSEIGFEEPIKDVKSLLSRVSEEMWNSNAVLNENILKYICVNNMGDYIGKFVDSLFVHDRIDRQNQYLKKYATIVFNEKTNPIIGQKIDWTKLSLFFNEQNLHAFWNLLEIVKGRQSEITGKIQFFFKMKEKMFLGAECIQETLEHQELMRFYGLKIKDLYCIEKNAWLRIVEYGNLYQLNKKNIQILHSTLRGKIIPYAQIKKIPRLYQYIKKDINDFVENVVLKRNCEITAEDVSEIILNPALFKKNVSRIVAGWESTPVDLKSINPRQYDNAESLNVYGIKALINRNRIKRDDESIQLLKLKYGIVLRQEVQSPELEKLKKMVKDENRALEKMSLIEEYIDQNSLRNNTDVVEYAIRVFLFAKKIGKVLYFASQLINEHFEYVRRVLGDCRADALSFEILSSPYIEKAKREIMLKLVDFPNRIISLNERNPKAAKYFFGRFESLLDDQAIVAIYKHVFGDDGSMSDKTQINYAALKNTLKTSEWILSTP